MKVHDDAVCNSQDVISTVRDGPRVGGPPNPNGQDVAEATYLHGLKEASKTPPQLKQENEEYEPLPIIPDKVWNFQPWLLQTRDYCRARDMESDMTLGVLFARYSSQLPTGTCMDTGIMSAKTSLNFIGAGIGYPGAGKSTSITTGGEIIHPVETCVEGLLGSGQGMAEAFMDRVLINPKATKGEKKEYERRQKYHNAFFFLPEGQALHKLASGTANTTLETLRQFAMGEPIGAANAGDDRKRFVRNYCGGIFIGYQPTTVGPLLDDFAAGTPQRVAFFAEGPITDGDYSTAALPAIDIPTSKISLRFDENIMAEIKQRHRDYRATARYTDEYGWMSHAALLQCKVAGLLFIITSQTAAGTMRITQTQWDLENDSVVTRPYWEIAGLICDNSHAIVKWLLNKTAAQKESEREKRCEQRAEENIVLTSANRDVPIRKIVALAENIARCVHTHGKMAKGRVKCDTCGRSPILFIPAADLAETEGWITRDETHISPGPKKPPPTIGRTRR